MNPATACQSSVGEDMKVQIFNHIYGVPVPVIVIIIVDCLMWIRALRAVRSLSLTPTGSPKSFEIWVS